MAYNWKRQFSKVMTASLAAVLLTSQAATGAYAAGTTNTKNVAAADTSEIVKFRLMETTDVHTNLLNFDYYKNADDNKVGLARTATLIKQARKEVENTFLVDNGDTLQGTPLGTYSALIDKLEDGEVHPMYKAMNALGYDAATLGNHEFNYGLDFLAEAIDDAKFPYVTANVYKTDKDDNPYNNPNLIDPYKIINKTVVDAKGNKHELKIGVIGFVPPQITEWDKKHLNGKVVTRDIVETANKYIPEMRKKGADIVIAMAHTGFNQLAQGWKEMEDMVYPLTFVPGIDAITFSHTHKAFPTNGDDAALDVLFKDEKGKVLPYIDNKKGTINGIPAVQAGFGGQYLGLIDFDLQKVNGKWKVVNSQSTTRTVYDAKTKQPVVELDKEIVDLVKPTHDATIGYVNGKLGETSAPIHSYFSFVQDDSSIQVVTNAQKWYVDKYVKANLPKYANLPILSVGAPFKSGRNSATEYTEIKKGDLTIRSAGDLYLYDNTLKAIVVKGTTVKEWLEMSAGRFNQIDPNKTTEQSLLNPAFQVYNFDVIDGVTYQVDVTQPAKYDPNGKLLNGNANRIKNLAFNGQPVDPNQEFIVVTNNYRAGGGGNFPGVKGSKMLIDSPDENRQILMDYIREVKTIDPKADGNWSILPINKDLNVTFPGAPAGVNYLADAPFVSDTGKQDAKGYQVYKLDTKKLPAPKKTTISVQLLSINDFHGQINVSGKAPNGKLTGRADYLATYLREREATNKANTLLVHSGDVIGASVPASALLQDEPTMDILNTLGFDLGTLGNHEFDEGLAELQRMLKGGTHKNTGNYGGAKFPHLAANIIDEKTGKLVFEPYTVKEVAGVKIGFIGVALTATPSVVMKSMIEGLKFTDETEAINKYAAELKKQGVRSIVVVSHIDGQSEPDGTKVDGHMVDVAKNTDPEVDVIIGGHSHKFLNANVNGKLLIQAESYGKAFADIDLEIDPRTKDIVDKQAEIVYTYQEGVKPAEDITAMIKAAEDKVKPVTEKVVGTSAAEITNKTNEHGEMAMGNLIADTMKAETGADLAFMNSGGVRNSLNAGEITWGELYQIQPFNNELVLLTVTGGNVRTLLNSQWADPTRAKFLQIAGLKYTWDDKKPAGEKIIDIFNADGSKFDESKSYRIVVNNFMAGGGDGYKVLLEGKDKETKGIDLDAFVNYVMKQKAPIDAKIEGRAKKL